MKVIYVFFFYGNRATLFQVYTDEIDFLGRYHKLYSFFQVHMGCVSMLIIFFNISRKIFLEGSSCE